MLVLSIARVVLLAAAAQSVAQALWLLAVKLACWLGFGFAILFVVAAFYAPARTEKRACVPISKFLSDKWDQRLYNWLLWIMNGGGKVTSSGVSSIYDPSRWRRGSRRASGLAILSGEAEEVDSLLLRIRAAKDEGGERVYAALVEWVKEDGTRGQQAQRLSMHVDTYRDVVDSGKRWLERLQHTSQRTKIKSTHAS